MGYNEPLGAEYDSRNPALQPNYNDCPACDGDGYYYESCCGDRIDYDTAICPTCGEHTDQEPIQCEECEGTGLKL